MDWSQIEENFKTELPNLAGRYVWTDVILQGDHHIQKNVKNGQYRLCDAKDKVLLKADYDLCKQKLDELNIQFSSDHLVLLIHGLGRHAGIMKKCTTAIKNAGFAAHSLNYATLFEDVQSHADHFEHLLEHVKGIKKVSFVTHSLGGLVVRELLKRKTTWNSAVADKLVMMGTPNKGAQIAEFLARLKTYQFITGPSGQDVRPLKKLKTLPPPPIPTLVIAGGRGTDIGYNPLLNGDNDGVVTVDETRLDIKHEFFLINSIHTVLMDQKEAIKKTIEFLMS